MFTFLRAAVGAMRPACGETLPSVSASLEEVTRATQSTKQQALEQAQQLATHIGKVAETLAVLEHHVSMEAESRAAWSTAVKACLDMAPVVTAVVRASEYREPTGDRLRDAVESLETMRQRFTEVLALLEPPK
jgi:hypothetical protein